MQTLTYSPTIITHSQTTRKSSAKVISPRYKYSLKSTKWKKRKKGKRKAPLWFVKHLMPKWKKYTNKKKHPTELSPLGSLFYTNVTLFIIISDIKCTYYTCMLYRSVSKTTVLDGRHTKVFVLIRKKQTI